MVLALCNARWLNLTATSHVPQPACLGCQLSLTLRPPLHVHLHQDDCNNKDEHAEERADQDDTHEHRLRLKLVLLLGRHERVHLRHIDERRDLGQV